MNLSSRSSSFSKWAAIAMVAAGSLLAVDAASARGNWSVEIGGGYPSSYPSAPYYAPPPVYGYPAPIYYDAQPIYVQPSPAVGYRPAPLIQPGRGYYGPGFPYRPPHGDGYYRAPNDGDWDDERD